MATYSIEGANIHKIRDLFIKVEKKDYHLSKCKFIIITRTECFWTILENALYKSQFIIILLLL